MGVQHFFSSFVQLKLVIVYCKNHSWLKSSIFHCNEKSPPNHHKKWGCEWFRLGIQHWLFGILQICHWVKPDSVREEVFVLVNKVLKNFHLDLFSAKYYHQNLILSLRCHRGCFPENFLWSMIIPHTSSSSFLISFKISCLYF